MAITKAGPNTSRRASSASKVFHRVEYTEINWPEGMISALGPDGEDQVGQAYFKGGRSLYSKIVKALGNHFSDWHAAAHKDRMERWLPVCSQAH